MAKNITNEIRALTAQKNRLTSDIASLEKKKEETVKECDAKIDVDQTELKKVEQKLKKATRLQKQLEALLFADDEDEKEKAEPAETPAEPVEAPEPADKNEGLEAETSDASEPESQDESSSEASQPEINDPFHTNTGRFGFFN